MLLILIGGGALVVVLMIIGIVITATSEQALVEERLGQYLDEEVEVSEDTFGERGSPVSDWLNRRLERSEFGGGLSRELARADLKLKPAEYVLTMLFSGIAMAPIFWYLGDRGTTRFPIFAIIGFFVGLFIPRIYVRRQQGRRLNRFNDQLADMLNLMVNGLRAGYSTMQAMEAVSREMPAPICEEFRRVVQEMQLGIPMDVALENLLRRIPSDDLDLVVTAINVQREVGGNLAEILDTISYTIRERVRIKGEIRVLTSQVMYSGRFLALMPIIISAVLWVLNRDYMMEFFNPDNPLPGLIALSVGGIMIMTGYFVMTRIANIEV